MIDQRTIVLGARSAQRRELLAGILPNETIEIIPPRSSEEPGFDDCASIAAIDARLLEIARGKLDDVSSQLAEQTHRKWDAIICADTTIIGHDEQNRPQVLGKPPGLDSGGAEVIRNWFSLYYAGRVHLAKTAVCMRHQLTGETHDQIVSTEIIFRSDVAQRVDWYISTGEPFGKAGGYAIQGLGAIFVERVSGSLTNVIGLPLIEVWEMLENGKNESIGN